MQPLSQNWQHRWLDLATLVATWSKDRSRQCGAVIIDDRMVVVSIGWNGFPRGINDLVDARHQRPAKYLWTEHAERNAIYNAAANGHKTAGCTMVLPWYPCAECARAIIQAGITQILCVEPDWSDATYREQFGVVREMLEEVGMTITFVPERLAPIRRSDV